MTQTAIPRLDQQIGKLLEAANKQTAAVERLHVRQDALEAAMLKNDHTMGRVINNMGRLIDHLERLADDGRAMAGSINNLIDVVDEIPKPPEYGAILTDIDDRISSIIVALDMRALVD